MGFSIRRTEHVSFTLDGCEITLTIRRLPADAFISFQTALASSKENDDPRAQVLLMLDLLTEVLVGWEGIDEDFPSDKDELRRTLLDAGVPFVVAAVNAYAPKLSEAVGND